MAYLAKASNDHFPIIEKNAFLQFGEDVFEHLRTSRSRSAPARVSKFTTKKDQATDWVFTEDVHTVMIRGIPGSCKREDILEAIRELGFNDLHDFFYAPTKKNKTLGYAFIGFPDAELMRKFAKAITGYRFPGKTSAKLVTVTPAAIQGVSRNLDHFQGKFVMTSSAAKPVFAQHHGA